MTVAQTLAAFAAVACLVVIALMLAARRGGFALVAAALLIGIATTAFGVWRASGRSGPGPLRSVVVALAAIVTGAVIVYLRRNAHGRSRRVITGVLAWIGLVFAWFETAYLLRS